MGLIIGLTGGIATGKTTIAEFFLQEKIRLIDSDKIVHQLFEEEKIIDNLQKAFGNIILNDQKKINRQILGKLIFEDSNKRMILNQIIHPEVRLEIRRLIDTYQNESIIVIDVPLLFEACFDDLCDKIIVVYLSKDLQVKRLMKRNHFTYEEAILRIDSQMDMEEKKQLADFVIDNSKSIKKSYQQFLIILNSLKKEVE